MSEMTPRLNHYGNVANNAFHNKLLMDAYTPWVSNLPIRMFLNNHAVSAPAWETHRFEVPSAEWVANPDWSNDMEAARFNCELTDLSPPASVGYDEVIDLSATTSPPMPGLVSRFGRFLQQTPLKYSVNRILWAQLRARRSLPENDLGAVNIVYGPSTIGYLGVRSGRERSVGFEHGTLRWMAYGPRSDKALRDAYRKDARRLNHMWVTNLDTPTLDAAEHFFPGRWSALPHPFMPSQELPYAENPAIRQHLRQATSSEALILLPSTQNWTPAHDKGSDKALEAFIGLRSGGHEVGLVAVEMGLQVQEAKEILHAAGVAKFVTWIKPAPRLNLQEIMASVDVVWDQFAGPGFGALALRAMEQGVPFVSQGIEQPAIELIGSQVPWYRASSAEGIVEATSEILSQLSGVESAEYREGLRGKYRGWLMTVHAPQITAQLQNHLYTSLVAPGADIEPLQRDEWSKIVLGTSTLLPPGARLDRKT